MTNMQNNGDRVPEIFKRHVGTWKGEYIKTNTRGKFLRSFMGSFTIEIAGNNYSQVNCYEHNDGSKTKLDFQGEFKHGILEMTSSSYDDFRAIAWDAGQGNIIFHATKTQSGALITFIETITLLDRDRRVRSTHALKDGEFDGISFIAETRQS